MRSKAGRQAGQGVRESRWVGVQEETGRRGSDVRCGEAAGRGGG